MQKIIAVLIILFPLLVNAQEYQSRWQTQAIQIDGDLNDWDERPGHFDATSNVLYGYRNDSSNLYVAFEISDKEMQMKAMKAGFNFEITVKSKPKLIAKISFPLQSNFNKTPTENDRPNIQEIQQGYKLMNAPALIDGFKYSKGSIYSKDIRDKGILYAADWDDYEAMIFEICIPFYELFEDDFSIEEIIKTDLIIHSTFAAIQGPNNQMQKGGMSMQAGGGGGGRGNGGPPGGGGGMRGGGQQSSGTMNEQQGNRQEQMMLMNSVQSFKSKFKLVFK